MLPTCCYRLSELPRKSRRVLTGTLKFRHRQARAENET